MSDRHTLTFKDLQEAISLMNGKNIQPEDRTINILERPRSVQRLIRLKRKNLKFRFKKYRENTIPQ